MRGPVARTGVEWRDSYSETETETPAVVAGRDSWRAEQSDEGGGARPGGPGMVR